MTQLYFIRHYSETRHAVLASLSADNAVVLLDDAVYQAQALLTRIPTNLAVYALQTDWQMRGLPTPPEGLQLLSDYSDLVYLTAQHNKVITL